MLLLFSVRVAQCPPVWKKAVHSFTLCAFRECLSNCGGVSFSFDFESWVWDLNSFVHGHCLSFYFPNCKALLKEFFL